MADANNPGPGRSTSEAAFNEVKRDVARRNEEAQKAGRKRRAERDKAHLAHLRSRNSRQSSPVNSGRTG